MRKRINYIFLLVAMMAVSCRQDANLLEKQTSEQLPDSTSPTYMNVVVLPAVPEQSRATTPDYDFEMIGEPRDYAIKELLLLTRKAEPGSTINTQFFVEKPNTAYPDAPELINEEGWTKPKEAWKTDVIDYYLAILANSQKRGGENNRFLDPQSGFITSSTGVAIGDADKYGRVTLNDLVTLLVRKDRVAMIGVTPNAVYRVQSGVRKKDAERISADEQLNNFSFTLERLVAKGAVVAPSQSMDIVKDGKRIARFTFEFFGVTRMPNYFRLISNGQNILSTVSYRLGYMNLGQALTGNNPYYKFTVYDPRINAETGLPNGLVEKGAATGYNPINPVPVNIGDGEITGVYFPENFQTWDASASTSTERFTWENVTHFKIYGTVIPYEFTDARPANWDGTFYYHKKSGTFQYAEPSYTYKDEYYCYQRGRGFYRALVQCTPKDADFNRYGNPVTNASVKRNYYYQIQVTGLVDLPSNWDALDPVPKDKYTDTPAEADELFIAQPSSGNRELPYDGIKAGTPINNTKVALRIRSMIGRWHPQHFTGTIGD